MLDDRFILRERPAVLSVNYKEFVLVVPEQDCFLEKTPYIQLRSLLVMTFPQ